MDGVCNFRGGELWSIFEGKLGFLVDYQATLHDWKRNDGTYFIVALLRKIKGGKIKIYHLIPCSNRTRPELEVKNPWPTLETEATTWFQDRSSHIR